MRHTVLFAAAFAALVGSAFGQWSGPIALPSDSAHDMMPAVVATGDSDLTAVWVSGYGIGVGNQIRSSHYRAGVGWRPVSVVSEMSPLIAQAGPGLSHDPSHDCLRLAYYRGSYPTDDDTWGICTQTMDSLGVHPGGLAISDTGVSDIVLRYNDSGQVCMLWTDVTGAGLETYSSVWFSRMQGDNWLPRQLVAAGMGSPAEVQCHMPAMCRDSGNRLVAAYVRQVYSPPSTELRVLALPDTATLGVFTGMYPAVVSDEHGTVMLACLVQGATEAWLLVRRYRDGVWSEPETLSATTTPGVRPRFCVDTEGLFWIVYSNGISAPPFALEARYFDGVRWSEPEEITQGFVLSPVIVPTYSGGIWAVWQQQGAPNWVLASAHRLGRPAIAESPAGPAITPGVAPTVGREFRLVLPAGTGAQVHDAAGRAVRRLEAGAVSWDGRGDAGERLAPGVYYVRAAGAGRKFVLR